MVTYVQLALTQSPISSLIPSIGNHGVRILDSYEIKCPRTGRSISKVCFLGGKLSIYHTSFEEIRFLGYGSFATVSHCRHNVDGCDYAVKKIAIGRYKEFDYGRVQREVEVMSRLHDNHIVRYMLSFVDAVFPDGRFVPESELLESDTSESEFTPEQCSCLCIVQELCDGTLKEHLSNGTIKKLSVEERLIILQQITEGLKYLHSKNFVHADLKPDNLLVLDETWKVSDFGLAHTVGVGDDFAAGDAGDVVMPGFYRPPASEVRDQHFDMYSLGVIIAEVLLSPATDYERSLIFTTMKSPNGIAKLFGPGILGGLLESLLGVPERRPSAAAVLLAFSSLLQLERDKMLLLG